MSTSKIVHDTFVIERSYPVPPARVFAAFADDELKRRWFLMDNAFAATESYQNDFTVGGKETNRFRLKDQSPGGSAPGTVMGSDAVYMDIAKDERVVYAYTMIVDDARISTSLATIQLVPEGKGTRLVFTEQSAYYVESEAIHHRRAGVEHMLESIATAIA